MTTGAVGNLKVWAALLVAAVSAAIVVAIMGMAFDAGTAAAATGTRATIEATEFTVQPGSNGISEASAVCPGEKRALGGGVVQSGPTDWNLWVRASAPLDSTGLPSQTRDGDIAKRWYASVLNISNVARTLKVFAICSGSSDATIEANPFSVASTQSGEGYAVCPGQKRALGGGVVQQSGTPDNLNVKASGPLDRTGFTSETNDGDKAKQWYAAMYNGSNEQRTFKVLAICSGTSNATIEATEFTVGPNAIGAEHAFCPATTRALGGGVVQSGSFESLWTHASGPLDSTGFTSETRDGDVARQWYAAEKHNAGDVSRTLRVFAICG